MSAPATRQAEVRRGELLAAARRVVERHGFAGATVGAITKEAGASLGLLHYHFGSRDEVVAEVFAALAREDLETLRGLDGSGLDAPARLAAWIAVNDPGDRDSWRLWVDAWGESLHAEAMAQILERFRGRWVAALRRTLVLGVEEGAWTCADPEATAGLISSAVDGIGLTATVHPDALPAGAAREWMLETVRAHLGVELDPDAVRAGGTSQHRGSADPGGAATDDASVGPGDPAVPGRVAHAATTPALRRTDVDTGGRLRTAALVALVDDVRDRALATIPGAADWTPEHVELEPHRAITVADEPLAATCDVFAAGRALRCHVRLDAADGTAIATAHVRMAR